jgi:putative ABC transport system permease protein
VLGLVLCESVVIALVGGVLGIGLAKLIIQQDLTQGLILLYLPTAAVTAGILVAVATGVVAGAVPALNAMRLNVATALRRL